MFSFDYKQVLDFNKWDNEYLNLRRQNDSLATDVTKQRNL